MRSILVFAVACVLVGACTKPNPDACCTTPDQCTSFGIDQLRPCSDGRVCTDNGACIASQCDVNADCTDPASPVCVAHQCVAKCSTDTDCTDSAAPKCDADGVCVACIDDAQCTAATAPICDGSAHACRGCAEDTECPSGVCLEFSGVCATADQLLFVSPSGTSNTQCTAIMPCLTIADAVAQVSNVRDVIRVTGETVSTSTTTIQDSGKQFTIDGMGATLTGPGSDGTPMFEVESAGVILIEGVSIGNGGRHPLIAHAIGGRFQLHNFTGTAIAVNVDNGLLEVTASHLNRFTLEQTGGATKFDDNVCTSSNLHFDGGTASVVQNQFSGNGGELLAFSAVIRVENNVFTSADVDADEVNVTGAGSGSFFQFNTLVNTSGLVADGQPLACDGNTRASSNIVAWNTTQAIGCPSTHSLFDSKTSVTGDNQSADVGTFFVNLAGSDFHLAPGSPALQHGDPSATLNTDFDGNPRPNPAGSAPDVGAYEAP